MKKNWYILFGSILFFAIIAGAGGYYYYEHYYLPAKLERLTAMSIQQSLPARNAYNSGNYTTSINSLQSLISNAPTKDEKARLQLLLASDLIARRQGTDLTQGTALLQQIIADYSLIAPLRATALTTLASTLTGRDVAFYTSNITYPPMNSYLPASGSDQERVGVAYSKILQLSDETYPTSSAEYTLANYYALLIKNGGVATSSLKSTAQTIQQYVTEGNSRNDQALYSPSTVIFLQLYRAFAMSVSGTILGNISLADQEKAFQLPLNTTAPQFQKSGVTMTSTNMLSALYRTRFYYANFLMENFGTARDTDIETLLKPFSQLIQSNPGFQVLGNLQTASDTSYIKTEAIKLSQISPDFKNFLLATGVTI